MNSSNTIQVFEHEFLKIEGKFKPEHFIALSKLNALHNDKYFDMRHNGIKFKQYVGVIQANGLTIEILPKIDAVNSNQAAWQPALIEMLKVTKKLKVNKVDEAGVLKQNIHLLDIYFEWFLNECELLIHRGLINQYYKQTANVKALKGRLEFAGHIAKNLVHKERFYTSHQVYNKDHLIHQVLAKALQIVSGISKGSYLYSRARKVQLNFPDVKDISVSAGTFTKIPQSRKTAPYSTALSIARFIILNYAPNIAAGNEKMIALLFDMNLLWEEYILVRLKQSAGDNESIYGQQSEIFWNTVSIRPDIVVKKDNQTFIIDTKWKNIGYNNPNTNDLRQLYVYNDYWKSGKAMLLYPSKSSKEPDFKPYESIEKTNKSNTKYNETVNIKDEHHKCGLGKISVFKEDGETLDDTIGSTILSWLK